MLNHNNCVDGLHHEEMVGKTREVAREAVTRKNRATMVVKRNHQRRILFNFEIKKLKREGVFSR